MKNSYVRLLAVIAISFIMFTLGDFYGRYQKSNELDTYVHEYLISESEKIEEVYRKSYEDELIRVSDYIRDSYMLGYN